MNYHYFEINTIRLILIAVVLISVRCNSSKEWDGMVQVQLPDTGILNAETGQYPAFYFAVYRGPFMTDSAYKVCFNTIIDDTTRSHCVVWGSKIHYDVAYYRWEDDTLVSVRLFNTRTEEEENFQAYGVLSGSGLRIN